MKRFFALWTAVVILLAGCHSDDHTGQDDIVIENEVIQVDDVEIMVNVFSYWNGSERYRRKFNDLTQAQIEALQALESLQEVADYCVSDGESVTIELTNLSGDTRSFYAFFMDGDCGYYELDSITRNRVSFESISKFMATYDCLSASDSRYGGDTIEEAFEVMPDNGCEFAFFSGPTWLKVNIEQPGNYKFQGIECGPNESTFKLYDQDGETIINEGEHEEDPGCWVINQAIDEAGFYYLKVEGNYGDYFVRIVSN